MSYYAAKFQKIRSTESWDNSLRNFWTELPQNYPFAPKKDFFETFTYVTFVYLLSSITMQRFKKRR